MICSKRKYAKNIKAKRSKCFLYGCKRVSRKCESYMIYLKDNSPHQTIMIVCEYIRCSHISNRHNMRNLCTLVMFSHTTVNSLLLLIHVQVQCDLAITRDTCVNIYLLNCLNLFFKYKIG